MIPYHTFLMTLCEVSLLHIKFLHWTASSNLIIFLRLVKEIIYANAGSWSVTNKEVFNVNVVALQWPSTLRCKMRSSNWIVFSSLLWRWSFDEEDAIPPFWLTICFYQHIHHVLTCEMLTRPIIAYQAFLPIDAKQVPSRVPHSYHSWSILDPLRLNTRLFLGWFRLPT